MRDKPAWEPLVASACSSSWCRRCCCDFALDCAESVLRKGQAPTESVTIDLQHDFRSRKRARVFYTFLLADPAIRSAAFAMGSYRQLRDSRIIIIITYRVATRSQRPYGIHGPVCSQSPGAGTMHSLQPRQLGNDSLLNMVLYPLLDMRGGASLCKPLEIPGGFWGSAGQRCLGSGHNVGFGRNYRKFPLSSGGFEPAT